MCGRFTRHYPWQEVHAFLSVFGTPRNLQPCHNIAPTISVDEVPATFNARAETVAQKPMFREAFRRRRCRIPASGFYEWTDDAGGKQPHLFSAADGAPILGFAGL